MKYQKTTFKQAFLNFLFSGSQWRTIAIMIGLMATAVGIIVMFADFVG